MFENANIILGGDFIFYLDPELDKDNNPLFSQEMNALLEILQLYW